MRTLRSLALLVCSSLSAACSFDAIQLELLQDNGNDGTTNGNGNTNDNDNDNQNENDNEAPGINRPPVAVINDGRPGIGAPAGGDIALTGEGSFDEDFDSLSFDWSTDGFCTLSGPSNEVEATVQMSDSACVITLTVSDSQDDDTVTVTISPVSTGTHVRAIESCVDGPIDTDLEQGTPANPWCTVAEGIDAALATGNLEVRLHVDPGLSGEMRIEGRVQVRGGWSGDDAEWSRSGDVRTSLQVPADSPVQIVNGTLSGVSLSIPEACNGPCAMVHSTGGEIRLRDVVIDGPTGAVGLYEAIRVESVDDFATLRLERVAVHNPSDLLTSVGVSVDGRGSGADVKILDSEIELTGPAVNAMGIRTRGVSSLGIEGTAISSQGDDIETVFAVLDGELADCPDDEPPCDGARFGADLRGLSIGVRGGNAVGIAAYGSGGLELSNELGTEEILVIGAQSAIGLHTVRSDDARLRGPLIIAAETSDPGGTATGWRDGVTGDPSLGSEGVIAEGARFGAFYGGSTVGAEIYGALLEGTRNGQLDDVDLETNARNGDPLTQISLRTLETEELSLSNSRLTSRSDRSPRRSGGALVDGELVDVSTVSDDSVVARSSQGLTVSDNSSFRSAIANRGATNKAGECLLLLGTTDSTIEASVFECSGDDPAATEVQIRTIRTEGVSILGNVIRHSADAPERFIGVLDGQLEVGSGDTLPFERSPVGDYGSLGLTVRGNRFVSTVNSQTGAATAIALGAGTVAARVYDNAIALGAATSHGIWLEGEDGTDLRHNTVSLLDTAGDGAGVRVRFPPDGSNSLILASNLLKLSSEFQSAVLLESNTTLPPATFFAAVFSDAVTNLTDSAGGALLVHDGGAGPLAAITDPDTLDAAFADQGLAQPFLYGDARLCRDFITEFGSAGEGAADPDFSTEQDLDGQPRDRDTPDIGAVEGHIEECPL